MLGDSSDGTHFPSKLLLIDRQVSRLRKAFANNSLVNVKILKTQLSKIVQLGGFSGGLFGPLLKTDLPLMKNVLKPLVKSVLITLGLATTASSAESGIHKAIVRSGVTT